MSNITLKSISKKQNEIVYRFNIPDEIKKHINETWIDEGEGKLFVKVPEEVRVDEIPNSVLSIPFIGTMMGVAMLYQIPIEIKEIDADYLESVKKLNSIFNKMYPKGKLKLEVIPASIVKNKTDGVERDKTSVFFTGGVDATSALVETVELKPLMINIVGGDIALSNQEAHNRLEKYLKEIKEDIKGTDYCFIESNCRELFKEYSFDEKFKKFISREQWSGYWASVAHIVTMTAIISPIIYSKNINYHYIGSSHSSQDSAFDANNEEIVNAINYCGCKFVSADAELDRNDKVKKIVEYAFDTNKYFQLQVCWHKENGRNCCKCEKCYRTIMNVLAAHGDPNKFGFRYDSEKMKEIEKFLETTPIKTNYWKTTQLAFADDKDFWKDKDLSWFIDFKFNKPKTYLHKAIKIVKERL